MTGSLLVSTKDGNTLVQVGSIIGMYAYVLRFASGLDTIPYAIQRLAALRDILRRVAAAAPMTMSPL